MEMYTTPSEAYLGTLHALLAQPPCKAKPRGRAMRSEIRPYAFTVVKPSAQPIETKDEERNKIITDYTAKEFVLYNSGADSAEYFALASKFWGKIGNPDGTVNSSYGKLLFFDKSVGNLKFQSERVTPWEFAKQKLCEDRDTRQAILFFSRPDLQYTGNKDVICTMHGLFSVSDRDQLDLTIVMRSNDAMFGLVYDMPWFCSLIYRMSLETGIAPGRYTHFAHNMHLYAKDVPAAYKMLYGGSHVAE